MPTVIWWLVGIVLILVILFMLGWLVLFLIALPKRKRSFEQMSKEFDETRARVTEGLRRGRREMDRWR